ncbi:MAG: hypothetical protein PHU45_05075 [Bacilli bacterium]|nr:hypothetical protein [Bacilli bacterium]
MKKKNLSSVQISILFVLIIGFVGLTAASFEEYQRKQEAEEKTYENNGYSQYEEIDFKTIYDSKLENVLVAKEKYLNNVYIFTGEITHIDDTIGGAYMRIEQYFDEYGLEVTVYFMKSQTDYIKTLKTGDNIKFYGIVDNLEPLFGFMTIDKAIIIK